MASKDRIPLSIVLLTLALGSILGSGALVYNYDTYYFGDRTDLMLGVLGTLEAGGNASLLVSTADQAGNARPDQPVEVRLETANASRTIFRGRTGSDGMLVARLAVPGLAGPARLVVTSGGETVIQAVEVVNETSSPKARVVISTDKPIYQPGQVIHIRTLAFGGADFSAAPGPVVLQVTDPNDDRIFRQTLQANEYGIASYDFPLSDQLPLGTYVIKASLSERVYVEQPVVVKRYVLPRFTIGLDGVKSWYTVDDTVSGLVNATYMFGEPVNGTVKLLARSRADPDYANAVWDTAQPSYGKVNVINGTLDHGRYRFQLPLKDFYSYTQVRGRSWELSQRNYASYLVDLAVAVTDEAGHKESKNFTLDVSTVPWRALLLADSFMEGQSSSLFVLVVDPSGEPVPGANVQIGYSAYGSGGNTEAVATTDERGNAALRFGYAGEGTLRLTISNGGMSTHQSYYIRGGNRIKVDALDRNFRPGEKASFAVAYGTPAEGLLRTDTVYYEVASEGVSVLAGSVTGSGGKAAIEFSVTERMAPAAELRVFSVLGDGGLAADAIIFTVERPLDLGVSIGVPAQRSRPGGTARLDFSVTGDGGAPSGPAALGVKIVDQSVYELGERIAGEDELFHGLKWSTQGPRYEIAMYMFSGEGAVPSFDGVAYEHGGSGRSGVAFRSTFSEYMASAGDRKDQLVNGYWAVLGFSGAAALLAAVGAGLRRRTTPARVGGFFVTLVMVVMIGAMLSGPVQEMMSHEHPTSDPGSLSFQRNEGPRVRPAPAAMAYDRGFSLMPSISVPSSGGDVETGQGRPRPGSTALVGLRQTVHVREKFPETWYWNPCIITDAAGTASVELPAPDTITTWGVDAAASTRDGRFGLAQANLTVFQEFFVEPDLPAYLVRNDTVTLPALVYNYLGEAQNITVGLRPEPWMEVEGNLSGAVDVPAGGTRSLNFTIRAMTVGKHNLTLTGRAGGLADIVVRSVQVLPDGYPARQITNGELEDVATAESTIVQNVTRIPGSETAYVKLIGSLQGVALDGAESFVRFARGCGEQSTSILTVNLAAYRNLEVAGGDDETVASLRGAIIQSIQYESRFLVNPGTGRAIAWHPGEPADLWLTAWAAFAYRDLEKAGFDVDEDILDGFEAWLLSKQAADGSWDFPDIGHWSINRDMLNKNVAATAYVLRALAYAGHPVDAALTKAADYIQSRLDLGDSAFTLSLSLLALSMANVPAEKTAPLAARLAGLRVDGGSGRASWGWAVPGQPGLGTESNTIETTAYAVMALSRQSGHIDLVRAGVRFILAGRQYGVWGNTHSTAVALQALTMEGAFAARDLDITVKAAGQVAGTVHIDETNNDLVLYVDLRPYLDPSNTTRVELSSRGSGRGVFQVFYEEYLPWNGRPDRPGDLDLSMRAYNTRIPVGNPTRVELGLKYTGNRPMLKMVLVEVPLPAGFSYQEDGLQGQVLDGTLNDFELTGEGKLQLYIDGLKPGVTRSLSLMIIPQSRGTFTMHGVRAFDMYNPELADTVPPITFEVYRMD